MFKKSILQFAILTMLAATPFQTSSIPSLRETDPDKEVSTDTQSEDSSEENPDEASPGDAQKGEWKETAHGYMYYTDGDYVSGWNKIDKVWYYFGADKIMKTDTNIGIYQLDSDGKLINDDGSTPLPHGEIYNSSASGSLIKNTNNIVSVLNKQLVMTAQRVVTPVNTETSRKSGL